MGIRLLLDFLKSDSTALEQMANKKTLLNQFDDNYIIIMIKLQVSDQKTDMGRNVVGCFETSAEKQWEQFWRMQHQNFANKKHL